MLKGRTTIVRKVEFDFVESVKLVLRSGHGVQDIELGALRTVFPDLVYQALIIVQDFPYKTLGITGRIRLNDEIVIVIDDGLNRNLVFGHTLMGFVVSERFDFKIWLEFVTSTTMGQPGSP